MAAQHKVLATADGPDTAAFATVHREFLDLAFRRLRLSESASAADVERAVSLIDSGALDTAIARASPPAEPLVASEPFADAQPFSYEGWKARHGVKG
jgi:hypothetical protein